MFGMSAFVAVIQAIAMIFLPKVRCHAEEKTFESSLILIIKSFLYVRNNLKLKANYFSDASFSHDF